MIKQSFKQAWQLLKQNKLFSSVYIIGTELAISMVMLVANVYYIKLGNIYPEMHRDRILMMRSGVEVFESGSAFSNSAFSYQGVKELFYSLQTPQAVTAVKSSSEGDLYVEKENGMFIPVYGKFTDAAFWKVFSFSFLKGNGFTEVEFLSGTHKVVISESLSKELFATTEVIGKKLLLNFVEYQICGVVKDVSYATPITYAQIWIPYTCNSDYDASWSRAGMLGSFSVFILMHSLNDKKVVTQEIEKNYQQFNAVNPEVQLQLNGQPYTFLQDTLRSGNSMIEPDWGHLIAMNVGLGILLLLIPAINFSGMISSRMGKRSSEIGLKKAFGASGKLLFKQVLYENFLLTFLGGILGLILSWMLVYYFRSWILDVMNDDLLSEGINVNLTSSMLLNPVIFLITFLSCLLLNIFSGIWPAWVSSRKNIIHSLYDKMR